jgi:hypothetical protein
MKITKTQLQNIIREELDALSEDEQLDEFFGPFSKKARAAKRKAARDKANAEIDARADAEFEASQNSPEARAERARREKEYGDRRAAHTAKLNKAAAARAKERETQSRFDAMGAESDRENRRSAKRNRMAGTNRSARGFKSNTAGAGRYAANRKDESKLRDKIREEVSKAIKEHFKK